MAVPGWAPSDRSIVALQDGSFVSALGHEDYRVERRWKEYTTEYSLARHGVFCSPRDTSWSAWGRYRFAVATYRSGEHLSQRCHSRDDQGQGSNETVAFAEVERFLDTPVKG